MENTHNSAFSKLMSFLFIAIGVFLGIYAFFANAEPREYRLDPDQSRVTALTGSMLVMPSYIKGISIDTHENIYVGGSFNGSIYFSGNTILSSGGYDGYIAKLDSNNNHLWIQTIHSTDDVQVHSHIQDSLGNIYLVGSFKDTGYFGSFTLSNSGNMDIFVAKITTDGVWQRAQQAGGIDDDQGFDISIDSSGYIYIVGSFEGTGDFGSTQLISTGGKDIFIAKLNSNGNRLSTLQAGGLGDDTATSIAHDDSGITYIAGVFQDTGYFGSTALSSYGDDDIFIAQLSNAGVWRRAQQAGGSGKDFSFSITTDTSGYVHLLGSFQQTGYFGVDILVSSGNNDIFIAKLASDSNREVVTQAYGLSNIEGYGIHTDYMQNVYILGSFEGTGHFGSTALVSTGDKDIFLAKLDSGYNRQWTTQAGGTGNDVGGLSLTTNSSGNILYTVGIFMQTGYFGSTMISSFPGFYGAFISKHVFDIDPPIFTGITQTALEVISGGIYNTGITITFSDPNLSGATLNGNPYTSGQLISQHDTHIFFVEDILGNSTGMTFIIDTLAPTFTGVDDGGYYNDDILITGEDTIGFSGFELSGTRYAGNSLLVTLEGTWVLTGYDLAGNFTNITFVIDLTPPTFTGADDGYLYSGNILLTGNDAVGFSGFDLSGTRYAGNSLLVTGEGTRTVTGYDLAGNTTGMTFTIDTTGPTIIGADNNGYYTTDIIITGSDINGFSGFDFSGAFYPINTLFFTGEGIYSITGYDILGNTTHIIFTIDKTNPIVTGNLPVSGASFTTTSNITFTRSGTDINMSGYTLYITGTEIHTIPLTNIQTHTVALPNGSYTRYVVAHDLAGNTGMSTTKSFTVVVPLTVTMTLLTGNLQYNAARYSKDDIQIRIQTNKLANYLFTGDIILAPFSGIVNGTFTGSLALSGSDGIKTTYLQVTDSIDTTGTVFTIRLDTTPPTTPTLVSPISGAVVMGSFILDRSDILDGGVGTSGYHYFIYSTGIYASLVKSGYIPVSASQVTIASNELVPNTTYYRQVQATDKLDNRTVLTPLQRFYYSGTIDTTPNTFSFTNVTNALLDRTYMSNTVTISGMTPGVPVLASINSGALYISGNFVGTTGYIQNGWIVSIELISSNQYNTEVNSTLTIGGVSSTYRVTTKTSAYYDDDYDSISSPLSNTTKLQIIAIFETLRDLYAGDKATEFFNTLLVMLQSRINSTSHTDTRDALQYLYNLVYYYGGQGGGGDTIDNTRRIVNGYYTAPNGKKYKIVYDSTKQRFSSPDFVTPKFFPTLDTLKYIIDINNPVGSQYSTVKPILARWRNAAIDGTWHTNAYTAPNKKAFYFFKDITGRYSSYTFTSERWFNSLNDVKEFIFNSNKK